MGQKLLSFEIFTHHVKHLLVLLGKTNYAIRERVWHVMCFYFFSQNARRQHKISEHSTEIFECVPCNRRFSKWWFLNAHLKHCKNRKTADAAPIACTSKSSLDELVEAVASLTKEANSLASELLWTKL